VRLRGGELDLESRGRLTLRMTEGRTSLVGDMEVLSGQFSLLGRQFAVQSGTLFWFGDEVLTPRLDLELSASVGNTLITVRLTGTMEQPLLELSSEPPLDEGEIMALLLFRRSTEELDNQQQDMLQRQATQLAADYGMAALQARLSRTLHIDLLRVETGGEEGLGTLMVGKYLGPRVLLRYEQSLSQQDLFRLNVDYILSRHLRLDTSTGSRGQSGMALNWSRMW
jgi:autotransporter translocation and assembly factor TamB